MSAGNVAQLRDLIPQLSTNDAAFAQSLCDQAGRRGLSAKQEYWVDKLIQRALNPNAPRETVAVGDFAGVIAFFDKARKHLKSPKIHLQLPSGEPVMLYVAGARSSAPGEVNVTDGGRYGDNIWYGRVAPTGTWTPSNRAAGQTGPLAQLLAAFGADPQAVAIAHGHLTGNCCFCNHKLEQGESTTLGYGPQCAKNFGLAWGKKAARAAEAERAAIAA